MSTLRSFFLSAVLLCALSSAPARAQDLSRQFCGVYRVEGVFKKSIEHPGFQELWVDAGTLSERRIVLGRMSASEQEVMDGVGVKAQILLLHSCFGECYGSWVRSEGLLDSGRTPRSLSADMDHARLERRHCLTQAQAREKVLGARH